MPSRVFLERFALDQSLTLPAKFIGVDKFLDFWLR